MRMDEPAQSVRKPPGSMMVTLMPSGFTSLARTSEKPSTPHFAVKLGAKRTHRRVLLLTYAASVIGKKQMGKISCSHDEDIRCRRSGYRSGEIGRASCRERV